MQSESRIDWIDLAKGICIILVVMDHVASSADFDYHFRPEVYKFHMPLFFVLSGLFYKDYESFIGFVKRKVNKLLIPFVFFMITTSWIPFLLYHDGSFIAVFVDMLSRKSGLHYNYSIWFLICLFEISLLFYFIQWISRFFAEKYRVWVVWSIAGLLGMCGVLMGINRVHVPMFINTALTTMPFFAFGWWLNHYTGFVQLPKNYWRDVVLFVIGLALVFLCPVYAIYAPNKIPQDGVILIYLVGISGTIMILSLSRMLNHLPLISFWGRYSIIILCTHHFFVSLFPMIPWVKRNLSGFPLFITQLLVVLIISHLLIYFMRRYMPHVTGQKDVLTI